VRRGRRQSFTFIRPHIINESEVLIRKIDLKKKIFMAGVGGMLGEAFKETFESEFEIKCTDKDLNAEWLSYLDFRDFSSYRSQVQEFKPDYLFHIGAHTGLEYCECNIDDAYLTNTISVQYATWIANSLNIPLLYISTAGIYDGSKETYDDWDLPNPLGVYARSKFLGEKFVEGNANKYLILRAGWMMGGGPNKDKKFIGKLMAQINSGVSELNIVNDKDGTPTYTIDFAKTCKDLLEQEMWGLYNCVCQGETSRLEVARELLKVLGVEDQISINEVTSDFFAKEYFAARPASERLINKKLHLMGYNKMSPWEDSLKDYVSERFRNIV
jgi:dTDP-4-dehydrorhamnose reductase